MRTFVIPIEGAAALNTLGILDALLKSERAWRHFGGGGPIAIDPVIIGANTLPVGFTTGASVVPGAVIGEERPDLVVVPGLDDDVPRSVAQNAHWIPWLARWHDAGAVIAASCTGAFLLAEAGLLAGRPATTHWVAETEFRERYPEIDLQIDRVVVDDGDVITSGGATTFLNLVHHLLVRFGSIEHARAAAKVLELDSARSSQLPFVVGDRWRAHADDIVHAVQDRLHAGPFEDVAVTTLAAAAGVSARTLHRRFVAATALTPSEYLARVRIDTARRMLETTDEPVERIREAVGYRDITAFRRAFKRLAGTTPSGYRRRYGIAVPTQFNAH